MNNRTIILAIVAIGVLIAALSYFAFLPSGSDQSEEVNLRPNDARLVGMGETIYGRECASCHGANLEGQPNWRQRNASGRLPAPPHDATGHTWHHPDAVLFQLTKFGPAALVGGGYQSDMPGYEGQLTDDEIRAVLSYIKSRWPEEIQDQHDQTNTGAGHQ